MKSILIHDGNCLMFQLGWIYYCVTHCIRSPSDHTKVSRLGCVHVWICQPRPTPSSSMNLTQSLMINIWDMHNHLGTDSIIFCRVISRSWKGLLKTAHDEPQYKNHWKVKWIKLLHFKYFCESRPKRPHNGSCIMLRQQPPTLLFAELRNEKHNK